MQNMLWSIVLYSEIKYNMGNEYAGLPTLLELLKRFDRDLLKTIWESFKVESEAKICTDQPAHNTDDTSDIENDIIDHYDESDNEKDTTISDSTVVNISEKNNRAMIKHIYTPDMEAYPSDANGFSKLSTRGITYHSCTWQ